MHDNAMMNPHVPYAHCYERCCWVNGMCVNKPNQNGDDAE
jgi:hypothetical protein